MGRFQRLSHTHSNAPIVVNIRIQIGQEQSHAYKCAQAARVKCRISLAHVNVSAAVGLPLSMLRLTPTYCPP